MLLAYYIPNTVMQSTLDKPHNLVSMSAQLEALQAQPTHRLLLDLLGSVSRAWHAGGLRIRIRILVQLRDGRLPGGLMRLVLRALLHV